MHNQLKQDESLRPPLQISRYGFLPGDALPYQERQMYSLALDDLNISLTETLNECQQNLNGLSIIQRKNASEHIAPIINEATRKINRRLEILLRDPVTSNTTFAGFAVENTRKASVALRAFKTRVRNA